jgi:hypothetical protein
VHCCQHDAHHLQMHTRQHRTAECLVVASNKLDRCTNQGHCATLYQLRLSLLCFEHPSMPSWQL